MAAKKTVFLSSVSTGLEAYREAVYHAIEKMEGYHCVRMEDFGARDRDSKELCRIKAAECDLFVGIAGQRYGSCPTGARQAALRGSSAAAANR